MGEEEGQEEWIRVVFLVPLPVSFVKNARRWARAGLPYQAIKDAAQMQIVLVKGGWFHDFDVVPLQPPGAAWKAVATGLDAVVASHLCRARGLPLSGSVEHWTDSKASRANNVRARGV